MPRKAAERKQTQEATVSAPVTVVIEPTQEQRARMDRLLGATQPKAEIVPFNSTAKDALVRPTVTAEDAKARWEEYVAICRAILEENDYMYYACYKDKDGKDAKPIAHRTRDGAEAFLAKVTRTMSATETLVRETKKRSAWDKLAKFYGISTPIESVALCATAEIVEVGDFIVEKLLGDSFKIFVYQDKATLSVRKVSVLLRVVSPNGRTILGDGACATAERGFTHADHDVFSTAFTRAFNRGVSRCIGTGEVSSEEFESGAPEPQAQATVAAAPAQQIPTEAPKAISEPSVSRHPADKSNDGREYNIGDTIVTDPKVVGAAMKVAADAKQTNDDLFGKDNTSTRPPKAEIPPMEKIAESAKQQTLPVEAPQAAQETKTDLPKEAAPATAQPSTQGVAAPEKFAPLGDAATLPLRIYAMKKFLFGKEDSDHRLVELLFFAIEPQIPNPVEILSGSKLQPNKWQAAMKELDDRKSRMEVLEKMLSKMGRDSFVEWGEAICKAARARKLF